MAPSRSPGLRVPLIDRLCIDDLTSFGADALGFYRGKAIEDAVYRELSRLLNTRVALKRKVYEDLAQDPFNFSLPEMYGLPEFTLYDASNKMEHWPLLIATCERAISYYEPRLSDVRVEISNYDSVEQRLFLSIQGTLIVENISKGAVFDVEVKTLWGGNQEKS